MEDRISEKTWYYLKHSKMLPEWKKELGRYGAHEILEQITAKYMKQCNKLAIILNENCKISYIQF